MRVAVDFYEAPSVAEWMTHLAEEGWKVTRVSANAFSCKKSVGHSDSYPVRQPVKWQLRLEEPDADDGVTVRLDAPAFAESDYSRQRLLSTIEDLADNVEGECKTHATFEIDLLGGLRRNPEE